MSSALRVLREVHRSELDGSEGGNRLLGCVGVARHSSLTYSPPLGCSRHCEHAGACSERDVPSRRKGQQSAAWYINLFSLWLSCLFWRFLELMLLLCLENSRMVTIICSSEGSQAWFRRVPTFLPILCWSYQLFIDSKWNGLIKDSVTTRCYSEFALNWNRDRRRQNPNSKRGCHPFYIIGFVLGTMNVIRGLLLVLALW